MRDGFQFGDNIFQTGSHNIGKVVGNPIQTGPPAPNWGMADRADPNRNPLVFMNYRSTDDKAATFIDTELTRRLGPGAVFRATRMPAGTEFPPELINRAATCPVMISVIGEKWDNTYGLRLLDDPADWVRREIATALAHGVHVVPVLVGARKRPAPDDLPEDIRKIALLQARHLRRGYDEEDVRRLVDELVRQLPMLAEAVFRGQ